MLEFNGTLLAQILHFIILLVVLRFIAYKPIVKIFTARQELITNSVATAESEKGQAEALHHQRMAELQKAREEATKIIQQATKAGEIQAQEIVEAAKAETTRVKENAMQDITREKEKAILEVQNQVAALSILVAEKIINQTVSPDIQHTMVQKFIDEAGELLC